MLRWPGSWQKRSARFQPQRRDDSGDDFTGRRLDRDYERLLARARLLQRVVLALQEGERHVAAGPRRHAPGHEAVLSLEIDEAHVVMAAGEPLAIGALQRRAGNDA